MKIKTKTIMAILTALVMLCSAMFIPTLAFRSGISSGGANYVVLEGVAGNDYYDSYQYSYQVNQWAAANIAGYPTSASTNNPGAVYFNASKSLRLGFTEYGELATPVNAGIAYGKGTTEWGNTESWAPSVAGIPPQYWIQGWVFSMNYTREGDNGTRAIEAYALYSDLNTAEAGRMVYSWYAGYMPGSGAPSDLTAGRLVPSGVEILYDDARLVVARSTVIIQDGAHAYENVSEVVSTLIFNKDTKYATTFQDVKILLSPKVLHSILDFSFSDRYELDLAAGINPSDHCYIHYYANNISSVYQYPLTGQNNTDLIQAYNSNPLGNYTFFAGYWPNATEYTVANQLIVPNVPAGLTSILPRGTAVSDIPGGEPATPWVTVQWNYNKTTWPNMLTWLANYGEMRFVKVDGMTDFNSDPHPAVDTNQTGTPNQVDTEVLYLLNQVFNPQDLNTLAGTAGNGVSGDPFMWIGLGQSAATTDSAGASLLGGSYCPCENAFPLFDKNDTTFYTNPMQGTIPYGLSSFGGNYYATFSNSAGGGADTTQYNRTGLMGFAFGTYDGETTSAQPIAGGWDVDGDYWFPSKDPLTQTWVYAPWAANSSLVTYHPNGILTLGGPKANGLTTYFNDFGYAITREGTSDYALVSGGTVTGTAPTGAVSLPTHDFFPISTWNATQTTFGYTAGYAVISLARDINGTRGLSVYGWNGRDTYWASAWAAQYLMGVNTPTSWLPSGTVALILHITYTGPNAEPSGFTIAEALGTITQFGTDAFFTTSGRFDSSTLTWSGLVTPPAEIHSGTYVWWYQKVPTTSTATIEFDP